MVRRRAYNTRIMGLIPALVTFEDRKYLGKVLKQIKALSAEEYMGTWPVVMSVFCFSVSLRCCLLEELSDSLLNLPFIVVRLCFIFLQPEIDVEITEGEQFDRTNMLNGRYRIDRQICNNDTDSEMEISQCIANEVDSMAEINISSTKGCKF